MTTNNFNLFFLLFFFCIIFVLMNLDEFPSLDFLLSGNTLQMKLIFGALAGLLAGILLIIISSLLVMRVRRKKRQNSSVSMQSSMLVDTSTAGSRSCANGTGNDGGNAGGLNTLAVGGELNTNANVHGGMSESTDSLDKNPDIIPQGKFAIIVPLNAVCKGFVFFLSFGCRARHNEPQYRATFAENALRWPIAN